MVRQELVTVTTNGRQVVRVSKEAGPVAAIGSGDPDRRAAEWVVANGRQVRILMNGAESAIAKGDKLPDAPFQVVELDIGGTNAGDTELALCKNLVHVKRVCVGHFFGNPKQTNDGVEYLLGCKQLETLDMTGAAITDTGVEQLTALKKLRRLDLNKTKLADAGLMHIAGLPDLENLGVAGTRITDAGLHHLKHLANMRLLNLKETAVTAEGVRKLAVALPKCKIEWDGGIVEPANLTPPAPSAVLTALRREQISPETLAFAGNGDPKKAPASLVAVLGQPEPIHLHPIACMAFSGDGRWLASADADQTILLRDAATCKVERVLRGHKAYITCLAFTPNNQTLVSGDSSGVVKLWPVQEAGEPTTVPFNLKKMRAAVSRDGRFFAAGGEDGKVKLWKWNEWDKPMELPVVNKSELSAIAFSADGGLLACGWSDKESKDRIALYQTTDGTRAQILPGHKSIVRSLVFSVDGKYLASAGDGATQLPSRRQPIRTWGASLRYSPLRLGPFSLGQTFDGIGFRAFLHEPHKGLGPMRRVQQDQGQLPIHDALHDRLGAGIILFFDAARAPEDEYIRGIERRIAQALIGVGKLRRSDRKAGLFLQVGGNRLAQKLVALSRLFSGCCSSQTSTLTGSAVERMMAENSKAATSVSVDCIAFHGLRLSFLIAQRSELVSAKR